MKTKRRLKLSLRTMPRLLPAALGLAGASALYLLQLGRLMPLGPTELQTAAATSSLGAIAANPLNLPYKLLAFLCQQLPFGSSAFRLRLGGALLALACIVLFYLLARRWHGERNAVLATLLFASSSWLLHTGRFGASLIVTTLLTLSLIALAAWVRNQPARGGVVVWYAAICSAALLIPAGVWFIAVTTAVVWRQLRGHAEAASRLQLTATAAIVLVAGSGLAAAVMRTPDLFAPWLGLPAQWPELPQLAKQALAGLAFMNLRGPFLPEVWLAHTPVLDAALSALMLLGALFYAKRWRNTRTITLLAFGLLSICLLSLHGSAALGYLVPLGYLLAATGLAYLSHQWMTVFPQNPVARGMALALIVVLTAGIAHYHVQRYYTAWRHSPDTVAAYRSTDSDLKASVLVQ